MEEAETIVKGFVFLSKLAPVDEVLTKLVKDVVVCVRQLCDRTES